MQYIVGCTIQYRAETGNQTKFKEEVSYTSSLLFHGAAHLELGHVYADSLPIMYLLQEVAHDFQHSLDVGLVIPPGLCEGDPAQGIAQLVNY